MQLLRTPSLRYQMHLAVRRTERCSIHRHATRSMTSVGHQPVHFVCGVTLFKYIAAALAKVYYYYMEYE